MKLILGVVLSTFLITHGLTQNLVTNGDFEIYSTLPNSSMDWAYCVGWNNVNMSASSWPYATPDYFHRFGSGGGSTPNTAFGDVNPQVGDAIIGLYSRHGSQLNSRDYMSRQMSAAMTPGASYTVSFWMTNGYGNRYYGSSCEHMGIRFSTAPFTQNDHENIGGVADVEAPGQPWLTNWAFYSFTYVATAAHQYITIGNFETDANTAFTTHDFTANYPSGAYYFFDDVQVIPANPLPITLVNFDAQSLENIVKTTWVTSSETNNDYFTIERSIDLENWEEIGVVDGAGNSIEENQYEFDDIRPLTGVTYYRLKQTDFDGQTSYADTRSVSRSNYKVPKLYPVPTYDKITVEADWDKVGEFRILNKLGEDVTSRTIMESIDEYTWVVFLNNLPAGMYYFKTGKSIQKIIKL